MTRCRCWLPYDHASDCEQVREQARVDAAFELLLAPMTSAAPGEPPAGQERPLAEREERG